MPSDSATPSRSSRSAPKRSSKSSDPSKIESVKKTANQAKEAAEKASDAVSKAVSGAVDAMGGWETFDTYIKDYNPTLYDFTENSFLKRISATNKPSKFLFAVLAISILQSIIPVFQIPLDLLSQFLSFVFLYNSGIEELKAGFSSRSDTKAHKVKSLLVAFLVTSAFQLIPAFLFDTHYHFGALWNFMLPVILFVTLDPKKPKETLGVLLADSVFGAASTVIDSITPDFLKDMDQTMTYIIAAIIGLCLWQGALAANSSYMLLWGLLGFSTINNVGADYISATKSSSGFIKQMTIWHNLLALWLWRYLVSAVESISIPGIVSVTGLITYHLPSYFLWMTGLFVGMLLTLKTAGADGKASTWYAKWLTGGFGAAVKKSSSSSSSSGSGSSSSRSGSGRSRSSTTSSSSDPKKDQARRERKS